MSKKHTHKPQNLPCNLPGLIRGYRPYISNDKRQKEIGAVGMALQKAAKHG